jgi:hypothetical protein
MLILALSSLAHAVPAMDVACMNTQVEATSPAPLQTDVPIDVVPAALLSTGNCGSAGWTATLLDAATGTEIASATGSTADGLLVEVDPGGPLAADSTYTFRVQPEDGGGEVTEIGFTTGSAEAAVLDGVPEVVSDAATWNEDAAQVTIEAQLRAVADTDGDTIIGMALADSPDRLLSLDLLNGPVTTDAFAFFGASEPPDEVCIVASQRDLAGRWSTSASNCVAPELQESHGEGLGGCLNVTRGTPWGIASVFLAAAGLVWRRRA